METTIVRFRSIFAVILTAVAAVRAGAQAQIEVYVPDNAPILTATNTIPFSGANGAYTYVGKVPASFLLQSHALVQEVALMPGGTGTWSAPNVLMGIGHLPNPLPCPFTFPGPGGATPGSFLDFTVIYDSTTQGTFTWPFTLDTWSPLGFGATSTGFIWNGIDDIGFYITFLGATQTGYTGGWRRSPTGPGSRTYAASYQAATSTACDALFALYLRLTCAPTAGLFANFTASPTSGPTPLTVNFSDTSFTSDPGGVTGWAWDVNGDGTDDYFVQNPMHTYTCPGSYSVRLTVTDAQNPPNALTRPNYISSGPFVFDLNTSGGGGGDLAITPVPTACFPTATHGYTLASLSTTAGIFGAGPFFGINPDITTITFILIPAAPGNLIHFNVDGVNYPDSGTLFLPAGTFTSLAGLTLDAVEVLLTPAYQVVLVTNVDQVTF